MANLREDVYIIEALRTPFTSFGGSFKDLSAPYLAALVIKGLMTKTSIKPTNIDEIIIGQVLQGGCGQAPARQAMLLAGLPDHIPATTINKVCGSGLKSMMLASNAIRAGEAEIILAGGMESMSMAPFFLPNSRFKKSMGHRQLLDMMLHDGLKDPYSGLHMGQITEAWLANDNISRKEQDDYAVRSYTLARSAAQKGILQEEMITVETQFRGEKQLISEDEGPKKFEPEKIDQLPAVFRKNGSITAANASSISDGAAIAMITGTEAVKRYKLRPIARLVTSVTWGMAPDLFPETDIYAVRKLLDKANLSLDDIGLFEINEAFAAVALLTIRELELDPAKVNVNGGAIAIGHPIGASGGRLVATLIKEMRRRKERYGIVTICLGGGEAVASLFELV